eukprot:361216_1
MNEGRVAHSCIVHSNQQLYAIGGQDLYSIEVLNVSNVANLQNQSWHLLNDTFPHKMRLSRAVIDGSKVVTIGGDYLDGYRGEIYAIDTLTNRMT